MMKPFLTLFFKKNPASHQNASFTLVVLRLNEPKDIQFYATLLKLLKPKGRLVHPGKQADTVLENLKLAGFVNANVAGNGKY